MDYAEGMEQLRDCRKKITALRSEMRAVQAVIVPQVVEGWAPAPTRPA